MREGEFEFEFELREGEREMLPTVLTAHTQSLNSLS